MPRKPKPDDPIALQVRMTEELRARLAESAQANGRSMNSEILWRLGQSFGSNKWARDVDEQGARLKEKIKEAIEEYMAKRGEG
jgi:hypothetical protein